MVSLQLFFFWKCQIARYEYAFTSVRTYSDIAKTTIKSINFHFNHRGYNFGQN